MNTERPTIRRRPARPVEADPVPSNVVQLRPNLSPTPANLQPVATEKRPKKASDDRGLQQPVSAFQVIDEADLSPPANANPSTMTRAEFRKHIAGMTKMQLRKRFKLEANSHRDIIARCKGPRFTLHPDFRDFGRFLWHLGPRPAPNWTVDRLDPANPEYGPGLCRWASPRTQANNRGITVHLTDEAGETRPLADWARKTGQKAKTIAKRRERGATDVEALTGRSDTAVEPTSSLPPTETASLDGWPTEASADRWEPAFVAFERRFAHWLGPHFRRAVFFAWLTGNKARLFHARIKARHPGFDDPDCDCPPNLDGDADHVFYVKLSRVHSTALRAVLSDPKAYDVLLGLKRGFPMETDPVEASRMTWKREDDGGGWQ